MFGLTLQSTGSTAPTDTHVLLTSTNPTPGECAHSTSDVILSDTARILANQYLHNGDPGGFFKFGVTLLLRNYNFKHLQNMRRLATSPREGGVTDV
jgi:hypothetical protein